LESSDKEIKIEFLKSVPAKAKQQSKENKKEIDYELDRRGKVKQENELSVLTGDIAEILEPRNVREAW
jgi:hypothetical protein